MNRRLWQAVADYVHQFPAGHVEMLALKVEGAPKPLPSVKFNASPTEKELMAAWVESGLAGAALAAALRAATFTAEDLARRERFDLVWTGPGTTVIPLRQTEVVLCEVIQSANLDLTLVSFVAYHVPSVVEALRKAVERHVRVRIILEAPQTLGGSLDVDSITKMRAAVPEARLYIWKGNALNDVPGVIHAKCAVSDGTTALVTSANLTGSAMRRNMELGVLIQGGRQPRRLRDHFDALIATRVLVEA